MNKKIISSFALLAAFAFGGFSCAAESAEQTGTLDEQSETLQQKKEAEATVWQSGLAVPGNGTKREPEPTPWRFGQTFRGASVAREPEPTPWIVAGTEVPGGKDTTQQTDSDNNKKK